MDQDEGAADQDPTLGSAVVPASLVDTDSNATSRHDGQQQPIDGLDFIGPSHAVKSLFSIPYSGAVSVAVHNMDGTLLIDAAADLQEEETFVSKPTPQQQTTSQPFLPVAPETSSQLIALPDKHNDALALIANLLQKQSVAPPKLEEGETMGNENGEVMLDNVALKLPPPEHYAGTVVPQEPREYLSWKFQNMNLLVGSDALIFRPQVQQNDAHSQALAIRVADASELRVQLKHHEQAARSYADVLTPRQEEPLEKEPENEGIFSSPDSVLMRLQTCIVPSAGSSVVGGGFVASSQSASPSSPVCTVLDAYLDNIMANVPQLALCLHEKGFIQSVKLLQTPDIPSTLMHPATLDVSSTLVGSDKPLFSPQVMEMNASMLLRFLRSNCTRDNATYLIRKEENQSNIELYDISSVSTQRQRKWLWWLTMISYRFAVRLGQLSKQQKFGRSEQRSFRARQRSLLHNALELLQDLNDRDGPAHETFCAAVCENLADTFLGSAARDDDNDDTENEKSGSEVKQQSTLALQPYARVSVDALNKAQDHLVNGIRTLWPVLERHQRQTKQTHEKRQRDRQCKVKPKTPGQRVVVAVHTDGSSSSSASDYETDEDSSATIEPLSMEAEAVTMQLFGLHHKLISVYLRLAEHHLHNYWSSSAMQTLRTAARRIADAATLLRPLAASSGLGKSNESPQDVARLQQSLKFPYAWLWEHCGFFARSFAADELWRDRGHCCGDDIICLLREVEAAFSENVGSTTESWLSSEAPISKETASQVSLYSLSAMVTETDSDSCLGGAAKSTTKQEASIGSDPFEVAKELLERQKPIKRDERRVLVAACVSYSRAIGIFEKVSSDRGTNLGHGQHVEPSKGVTRPFTDAPELLGPVQEDLSTPSYSSIRGVFRQRLGDACNEIGKILLNELRAVLTAPASSKAEEDSPQVATGPLLSSAQFWFLLGLQYFEACKDLRNIALLRCNLCQCSKLRANNMFSAPDATSDSKSSSGTHAETCLQDAADHLQMAHEALGQRDADPLTWDMVSEELAATFLVLGVRRRQSLLGGGSTPVIVQAMRLTPGKERSIVDPMERSLVIYESLIQKKHSEPAAHQAAAVHYQLALFYSKVWTCQRDENKTREKLSKAFQHYGAAHKYFSTAPRGQEPTFCILCLDLSNLYAAVSGQECLSKALDRCLDTSDAFSPEAVEAATARHRTTGDDWFDRMSTLASSIEDRVFKLLLSLVKWEKESNSSDGKYKELYRVGLTAKASMKKADDSIDGASSAYRLSCTHDLLIAIQENKNPTDAH